MKYLRVAQIFRILILRCMNRRYRSVRRIFKESFTSLLFVSKSLVFSRVLSSSMVTSTTTTTKPAIRKSTDKWIGTHVCFMICIFHRIASKNLAFIILHAPNAKSKIFTKHALVFPFPFCR